MILALVNVAFAIVNILLSVWLRQWATALAWTCAAIGWGSAALCQGR